MSKEFTSEGKVIQSWPTEACEGHFLTFSPEEPVRTKVEKTGREYLVWGGQHSSVAPMGRQKRGTDSGRGKLS